MTNLYEAQLTDGLPYIVRKETEVKALSEAVKAVTAELKALYDATNIYTDPEALTDTVCDLLADELRIPEYSESDDLYVKRDMVKNALAVFSTAGTRYAVETLVQTIFGSAEVSEWFQYGGEPGYFTAATEGRKVTEENLDRLKEAVESVKRASAWLEEIIGTTRMTGRGIYIVTHLAKGHTSVHLPQLRPDWNGDSYERITTVENVISRHTLPVNEN